MSLGCMIGETRNIETLGILNLEERHSARKEAKGKNVVLGYPRWLAVRGIRLPAIAYDAISFERRSLARKEAERKNVVSGYPRWLAVCGIRLPEIAYDAISFDYT